MVQASDPIDGTTGVISSLQAWAKSPFSSTQDLSQWFLWTGLVIVMVIAWIMILREIETKA